jgi:conjugative transposon TraN protein
MKHIPVVTFFLALLTTSAVFAQPHDISIPASALVPHFRLSISYNTTTVLVFRAPVRPVDRGDRDVITQKQPGVDNVLKLKAARRNFAPTNVHVFTSDGRLYAFDVSYTDSLASTYDLSHLENRATDSVFLPAIALTGEPVNTDQLAHDVVAVRELPAKGSITTRAYHMKVTLETIALRDHLLFFRIGMANHSQLDYTIDFIRLYVRDQKRAKRSSVQEQELVPIYQDSVITIPGNASISHVMALPAFTFPNNKRLIIEVYEKNGGRSLTLTVGNKHLFKAQ